MDVQDIPDIIIFNASYITKLSLFFKFVEEIDLLHRNEECLLIHFRIITKPRFALAYLIPANYFNPLKQRKLVLPLRLDRLQKFQESINLARHGRYNGYVIQLFVDLRW